MDTKTNEELIALAAEQRKVIDKLTTEKQEAEARAFEMSQKYHDAVEADKSPAAPAAAVVTVETPGFMRLLGAWSHAPKGESSGEAAEALIAHIDAHTSQAAAAAERKGWDACATANQELIRQLRDQIAAPQQHAQSFPSLEEFHARFSPPAGYEDCRVISRNDQLIWLRDADVLPTDLVCFFDGDCRDVLTPYDNRVQPPMKLVQQPAQAALSDDQQEGRTLLDDLIASIAKHGNYSKEATLTFLNQIRQCFGSSQQPAAAPTAPPSAEHLFWRHDGSLGIVGKPATATNAHPEVGKMLETNQLDELGAEVARLQTALCFWLPSVTDREDEVALRILDDAFLLVGIDGNLPDDFKSAQELGWVSLAVPPTPPQEAAALDVEAAAKAIYALLPEYRGSCPEDHPWQDGGNSDMQELARNMARAALADKKIEL